MKTKFTLLLLLLAGTLAAAAQSVSPSIPSGYYRSAIGKSEGELKTALCKIIYNHTEVSSYNALPSYFQRTDTYPSSNRWWDMYSDIPLYAPSFWGLNREHSFPKSWWGGTTTTPAYTDLFHLYPAEAEANMAKSNYPLGEVTTGSKFDNGMTRVGPPVAGQGGGAGYVFEPDDEYKGDFARTYFYVATCYQDLYWKYTYMVSNNSYPTLNTWSVNLLLKWHRQDPVSDKEVMRNEEVYKIQNNRNPFIDYPQLAEYLWGNKRGEAFDAADDTPAGEPNLITPVQDMSLDFNQTTPGKTVTSKLFFKGENLTKNLSLSVTGDDKDLFTLSTTTIAYSLVNSESGCWLDVSYTPTEVGQHSARLIIARGGLVGTRGIALIGECLEVPTLTAPTALPAEVLDSDSYMAHWESAADETVDYYIVTRTRYFTGNPPVTEEVMAEGCEYLFDDFNESDSESYNVRSVRLGYESAQSNEVYVAHDGVESVAAALPIGWAYVPGGIRIVCGQPHTGVRVYDTLGRLVRAIPSVANNDEILLPRGVFLIVTDQQPTPLRVAARD